MRAKVGPSSRSTKITGFRLDRERIAAVATDHGDFAGRDVIFALGAWSPLLARQLDLRIPIQPGKGCCDHVHAAAALSADSIDPEGEAGLRDRLEFRVSARQHDGICRLRRHPEPHAPRMRSSAVPRRYLLEPEGAHRWSKNGTAGGR